MSAPRKAAAYSVLTGLENESSDKALAEGLGKRADAYATLNQMNKAYPTYAAMQRGEPTKGLSPRNENALEQGIKTLLEQNHTLRAANKLAVDAGLDNQKQQSPTSRRGR